LAGLTSYGPDTRYLTSGSDTSGTAGREPSVELASFAFSTAAAARERRRARLAVFAEPSVPNGGLRDGYSSCMRSARVSERWRRAADAAGIERFDRRLSLGNNRSVCSGFRRTSRYCLNRLAQAARDASARFALASSTLGSLTFAREVGCENPLIRDARRYTVSAIY
jgi:hypothetical protein